MEFDKLQEAWKAQEEALRLPIEPDLLLKEIQTNKRYFEAKVFWRDVREVGVCVLMAIVFVYSWVRTDDWPWGVFAASCLFVAGFMVVDRIVQRKRRPVYSEPLSECAEGFLKEVNHQIWLLRTVFWWYLLPFAASIAIFLGYSAWNVHQVWWLVLISSLGVFGIVAALYYGLYRLNQLAVQKVLEPRRAELKALLQSLRANENHT
jgi:hypothetical protein